jgi:ribosomal-protein-alanine N-acetyltransferase
MLREGDIILRPLSKDDAPVLASLLNNKKIWDNLRDYIPYPYLLNDALSFIQHTVNEVPQLTFAIEYKSHLAGIISLVAQTDIYKRTAEIGYWLGEPYWQHAFDELDFIRIHTGVIEYNIGSMNVLAKNRYTQEGIFRKAIIKNGQLHDEHRFAKIKE